MTGWWPWGGWGEASGWLGARKGTSECQGKTATERGSTLVHTAGEGDTQAVTRGPRPPHTPPLPSPQTPVIAAGGGVRRHTRVRAVSSTLARGRDANRISAHARALRRVARRERRYTRNFIAHVFRRRATQLQHRYTCDAWTVGTSACFQALTRSEDRYTRDTRVVFTRLLYNYVTRHNVTTRVQRVNRRHTRALGRVVHPVCHHTYVTHEP